MFHEDDSTPLHFKAKINPTIHMTLEDLARSPTAPMYQILPILFELELELEFESTTEAPDASDAQAQRKAKDASRLNMDMMHPNTIHPIFPS